MKYIILIGIVCLFIVSACQPTINPEQPTITTFEECVAAGNPVMESYPRQCSANGNTFVEQLPEQPSFHECTEAEKQAEICTLEYNPVCGLVDNGVRCITEPCPSVDAKTFGNGCGACSAQATGYYPGECQDQLFVVCKETVTGFSAEQFAEDAGGICVDICPGNFDPYTTQIGVEVCIMHYGEEEIAEWPTCSKSTESCDCVKTTETTDNQAISNPEYRCVPEQYGERLLFRSGKDFLDEKGQQAVVIA